MNKLERIKSYYFTVIVMLILGLLVNNVLYAMIFSSVSIFIMSYHKQGLNEMFITSILFVLSFLICDIVVNYIPFEFVAFNYSKALVLMMLLVGFKSKFNFEIFMENYQVMSIRLVVVVFVTLGLLMINYQLGVMAYLSAMFTILLNDFIFQKENTKVTLSYDKISA